MRILKRGPKAEVGAVDLLEEATHLLRRAPLAAWVAYTFCVLPFLLGCLYFVADMSRGARAWEHLSLAALGMALLFVLMKVGQALFCDLLLHAVSDEPFDNLWRRLPRLFCAQLAVQPFGLFLLPVALLLTLPFGWCFALFQNFCVFGQGRQPLRQELALAWQQSKVWPAQNHLGIALLIALWLILLPVIAISLYMLPHLLHTLFGLESVFVQSDLHMLNTTFWTIVFMLSYLLLDPLAKAAYVLRCFFGVSLKTGADLRVDLRRLGQVAAGLILILVTLVPGPLAVRADEPSVSEAEMHRAISQEMSTARYEWRHPRDPVPENHDPGLLASLGDALVDALTWIGEQIGDLIETLDDWLQKLLPDVEPDSSGSTSFLQQTDPLMLGIYVVSGLGLCLASIWLYRHWRRRQRREKPVVEAVTAIPDLESEDVTADDLPAERWATLANELLGKGEVRLALRAMILGALARLADGGYFKLARYKSNRDYLLELRRRGQSVREVAAALADNVTTMEGVWYGDHRVSRDGLNRFLERHERVMRHGA